MTKNPEELAMNSYTIIAALWMSCLYIS